MSDFRRRAVSLAISAALDLWSSEILEFALELKHFKYKIPLFLPSNSLFQPSLSVNLEDLEPLLLLLVLVGEIIQRGLQDVLVIFEARDDLLGSLVFPVKVGKCSLHCLEVLEYLVPLSHRSLALDLRHHLGPLLLPDELLDGLLELLHDAHHLLVALRVAGQLPPQSLQLRLLLLHLGGQLGNLLQTKKES